VAKNAVFLGGSSLLAQTYGSLTDVQKFITLRLFSVLGRVNNRWKQERALYNYCIGLPVWLQTCWHQNWIFWLLLAAKSELASVSEIFVLKFSWWIQGSVPVMVFQQHDGASFILYPRVLLSQDGVDPHTNSQLMFPSTTMRICPVGRPVVKPLFCVWALDRVLEPSCPWWKSSSLELRWRVIDLPLPCGCWFIIPKPYLDFSLVRSPNELPLERACLMPFTGMVLSCSIH
jgi:hypothetical protein